MLVSTNIALYTFVNCLCAIILIGILIINKGYGSKSLTSKYIKINLLIQSIYFLLDVVWVHIDGVKTIPIFVNYLVNGFYYTFGALCGYLWFLLVVNLVGTTNMFSSKKAKALCSIPAIISSLLAFTTCWTKLIFTINEDHIYERGNLVCLMQTLALLYILSSAIYAFAHSSKAKLHDLVSREAALLVFTIPPITCAILQLIFPGVPFLTGGITFSMVYLYTILMHDESLYQNAIITDLADDFECIVKVDMLSNQMTVYRGQEMFDKLTRNCKIAFSFNRIIMAIADEFVCDEDKDAFIDALSKNRISVALSIGGSYNVTVRDKEKYEYYTITIVHPGKDDSTPDILVGIHKSDEDMRREKEIQDELSDAKRAAESANRMKSNFLFNMSHDIRTPMNAIIGFTDLATKHIDDKERVEDCLAKVQTSSEHLLNLINDVLDMARIENNKVKIEKAPINIHDCIDGLITIMGNLAKEKNIDFEVTFESIIDENVIADELHVNEVLLNVISNAIKYTPNGGRVKFTIRQVDSRLGIARYEFVVRDNGMGMSEEFLQNVFDSFEREHTAMVSGIQGTGLGMSITKRLVDLMGGDIFIESTQDVGTMVAVHLDFDIYEGDPALLKKKEVDISNVKIDGIRVLLVDDNELNRELAVELLEEQGVKVETAVDGTDALGIYSLVDPGYYDLILMDVQMPKMNGYEATQEIRKLKDAEKANIPIIAMTANAFKEDRDAALASGMNAHLTKPLNIEKLMRTIAEYTKA